MTEKFETYCGKKYWIDKEILFIEKGVKLYEVPLSEITKVEMWCTETCMGIDIYCKSRSDSITITATDYEDGTDTQNERGKRELMRFLSLFEEVKKNETKNPKK